MKKIIAHLVLFFLFFIFFQNKSQAAENFKTSYDVTYTVAENSNTHVNFNAALTNTTSSSYASSYSIILGFKNIENVKASDPDGNITPEITETNEGQKISLVFNKRVVGIKNTLNFNLSFDTKDVTEKVGSIWEVNIPGISNKNDFDDFNVHVKVPSSFGKPSYVKPQKGNSNLDFTKNELEDSGVSIAFGDKQIYSFALKYHLKNSNLFSIATEIALPPITNYQNVFIDDISPKPLDVKIDSDGNWLAQYRLAPSEKKDIVAKGKAEIFLNPKEEQLSPDDFNKFLASKPYWEASDEKIKKLANELKTPEKIYQYVVSVLNYDYSRLNENKKRLGAIGALENPNSAVCLEFTDLFIAIARAAGIPARELDGYAYTQDSRLRPVSLVKDILHAWPEYYDKDKKRWIMIDPTWGNTTKGIDYFSRFDFDHFAFIIKGENSDYPVPAGGYKLLNAQDSKDVEITFTNDQPTPLVKYNVSAKIPGNILSALPIQGAVTISNIGNTLIDQQEFRVNSSDFYSEAKIINFGKIPPFGQATNTFSFPKTPILTNKSITITIHGNEKILSQQMRITPFFITWWSILGGILLAILSVILSVIAFKTGNIPFFRQKR